MGRVVAFKVKLRLPEGADRETARHYILDAVSAWHGSLNPVDDPMFDLDSDTVEVTDLRKK